MWQIINLIDKVVQLNKEKNFNNLQIIKII